MKTLIATGGRFSCAEIHEPPLSSHSVKVRLIWSCISFGTESGTVRGQTLKSVLHNRAYWQKATAMLKRSPYALFQRFLRLRRGCNPLGYSAIGEVVSCGHRVARPLPAGTLVHVGGEYASHAEYVTVPQQFVFPLLEGEGSSPALAAATIASVPIHALQHAFDVLPDTLSPNVIVIGGGIIGTFACLYAKYRGWNVRLYDKAPQTLADSFTGRTQIDRGYDIIAVCTPSMDGIEEHIAKANEGAVLSIVGETPLKVDRSLLEAKYMTVRFCMSFGYGRGDKAYEFGCKEITSSRFPHTFRNTICEGIMLMRHFNAALQKHIHICKPESFSVDHYKINVISWR